MPIANAKIKGDIQVIAMLRQLGSRVARKVNRQAVSLATTPMLKACRAESPIGTGHLQKSLIKKVTNRGMQANGIVGADTNYVGENGERPSKYDHLVEYGHATPDGKTTSPDPFLQRGYEDSIGDAREIHETKLAAGVEAEALKLGGG